ncbi:MAG: single-stranded DNA-binding protein [Rikenellaceae bacterium]
MINRVILQGYVGDDPEVRSFESGTKMARIRMATNETIHIRKSGETKQHTEWHTVIFWGKQADIADKKIRKGTLIYIEGALRNRKVSDKEGVSQTIVEIVGNKLNVISQPKEVKEREEKTVIPEIIPPKDDSDNLPF